MENYNLKEMTAQEVFNASAKHLLTQNKTSANHGGSCRYRYGDLKCAAGIFITETQYEFKMEGIAWDDLTKLCNFLDSQHTSLICELQEIHDNFLPIYWKNELNKLAEKLNLKGIETNENQLLES